MDVKEAIVTRRSIRKFKETPIDKLILQELLEAARLAPSGTNIQPWRFIAVTSLEMKAKLKECTIGMKFIEQAPLIMVCCADLTAVDKRSERISELVESGAFAGTGIDTILTDSQNKPQRDGAAQLAYVNLNVAIAIEHMILRGVELGLGSCWLMLFRQSKVKELFKLPDTMYVTALVPFGYPDQEPEARPRLPLENIYLGEV
ncbi:MAG: nitroreductase family protein [Clostridiales bacterium]|jgi:nitroreductase|nr:nitroreductase family protein [Clostridiales bacterium]